MVGRQHDSCFVGSVNHRPRFLRRERQRFFAQHVDAAFDARHRDREVVGVRHSDNHAVNAIQDGFIIGHALRRAELPGKSARQIDLFIDQDQLR